MPTKLTSTYHRIVLATICLLSTVVTADAQVPDWRNRPWNRDVIYFVMTDRFLDGDSGNNQPTGSDPSLYDPNQADIGRYHGGDFRGLEIAIRDGYFTQLGITAIWMTPPVRNAWNSLFDLGGPKTGYHGYWTQDFLDIDPHLTSRTSLDGTPYTDDRDGRMQHYQDLVSLAHQHNIKIIQDIVCNHVGPLFYYDTNGNGSFDIAEGYEWFIPYKDNGFHDTAAWSSIPKWNLRSPGPAGPLTLLGKPIATTGIVQRLDVYGRKGFSSDSLGKSDGEEVTCDFFSLRDFWTKADSSHFDELVDEFVKIYAFYLEEVGVDGFRIDTIKHVHHEFWDQFTERMRARVGSERAAKLLMFGEVYDGNPKVLGRYTYRSDDSDAPCLDSLLNFQLCFNLRDYLRVKNRPYGSPAGLRGTIDALNTSGDKPTYNPTAGADGLSSRQKMVNFFENHDGINRFLVDGVSLRNNTLALGIAITMEGIPCIYYGTEVPLQDERGQVGKDAETGRLTYCIGGNPEYLNRAKATKSFGFLNSLTQLRQQIPALHSGRINGLWVDSRESELDDGVFAFARYIDDGSSIQTADTIVIVVNADPERSSVTATNDSKMSLMSNDGRPLVSSGQRLRQITTDGNPMGDPIAVQFNDGAPQVNLRVAPQSFNLFRVESN